MSSPKRSAPSPDRTLLGLGFEVSGFPALVEGCLLGAVDAEADEPACSGVGLDPLVLVPGRGGEPEQFPGDRERDGELVGPAAVEVGAGGVAVAEPEQRSGLGVAAEHGRGSADGLVRTGFPRSERRAWDSNPR